MSEAPWVRWFASDFLNGVADLEADERGVYITLLSLIFDKGAPIDDDSSWLARRSGCSTRRFNQIRAKLIEDGKLESRGGMLGNRKALAEVTRRDDKSNKARHAAHERWRNGDSPELPLENEKPPIISRKKRETTPEHNDLISRKKQQEPQKSANGAHANASRLAGAREEPEPELEESSTTTPTSNPREVVADDVRPKADGPTDLHALANRCAMLGGVPMISPGKIAESVEICRIWVLEQKIDVEKTIIPAITKQRKNTRENRISSLSFYGGAIAKAHADAIDRGDGPPSIEWNDEQRAAYQLHLQDPKKYPNPIARTGT